jgi:23S rRNA (guanosine2251-2'-O)-methyltransferase
MATMKPDLDRLLTIYGRKPVLEALQDSSLEIFRLHLSESNRPADILREITQRASLRKIAIQTHDKLALSRISKNSQQDQGVALDIHMPGFMTEEDFCRQYAHKNFQLVALDGITNPQNLGMIIRSVCASPLTGILLPRKGCAKLDALVIKASAGTLFKCRLLRCDSLPATLSRLAMQADICLLDSNGQQSLFDFVAKRSTVFVLGNETTGVTGSIKDIPHTTLRIPMQHQVESLNVAVTAALVAFNPCWLKTRN